MSSFKHWILDNRKNFQGEVKFDELLSKHTYYKIGGPADYFFTPHSLQDLVLLKEGLKKFPIPYFICGAGSNILVSDHGFRGLVIKTTALNRSIEEIKEESVLKIGVSVMISSLLRMAMQKGWGGLEFLAGVPGSLGGIVFMNAGTHLGETKSALKSVSYFSLEGPTQSSSMVQKKVSLDDFEYRKNRFLKTGDIVMEAYLKINLDSPESVQERIQATLKRRKESQPVEVPSCGSVFKNPISSGLRSWQVIDQLGLRGFRIGNAQFSEKHSNFIINCGSAQAADVFALIELAKKRALAELQIQLEEEVKYVGEF